MNQNICKAFTGAFVSLTMLSPITGHANTQPYVGEIQFMASNVCPQNWVPATGQTLSIQSHEHLYAVMGTTYGGDGRTSFALPDLRGRTPIGSGTGPELKLVYHGSHIGQEGIQLTHDQLPQHTHSATTSTSINAYSGTATVSSPDNAVLANDSTDRIYNTGTLNVFLADQALQSTTVVHAASNTPADNMQPYQVVTACIAINGIFPQFD